MYTAPTDAEVIALAADLGIRLSAEEAPLYREALVSRLRAAHALVQSRIDHPRPPLACPARPPGYRPDDREDPLNAWMWRCRIGGDREGLLAGRTVSFKDNIAVQGMPMSFGSLGLDHLIADVDATVVNRVLEAGGTVVGKNVMTGFGGGFGDGGGIGDYGRPLNPHAPTHTTGGSSSGCAVAVAAGEVDIAFGGDQGGSIRVPAAYCGVLGLKPTFGLVSHFGISFGADQSIDHTGPLARSVEDCARALQATAGWDDLDPRQTREVPQSVDVLSRLDDGVDGLRLCLLDEGFAGADEEVAACLRAAAEVFRELGAVLGTSSIPEHGLVGEFQTALKDEGALATFRTGLYGMHARTYYPPRAIATVNDFWRQHADQLSPRIKLSLLSGELCRRSFSGVAYATAHNLRPVVTGAYDAALREADLLLLPTVNSIAPEATTPPRGLEAVAANLRDVARSTANTSQFNYTGHPALALPVGKVRGLPVSLQLVGRHWHDGLLLRAARAYEQAVGPIAAVGGAVSD